MFWYSLLPKGHMDGELDFMSLHAGNSPSSNFFFFQFVTRWRQIFRYLTRPLFFPYPDPNSGCPPIVGEKFGANKWINNRNYVEGNLPYTFWTDDQLNGKVPFPSSWTWGPEGKKKSNIKISSLNHLWNKIFNLLILILINMLDHNF